MQIKPLSSWSDPKHESSSGYHKYRFEKMLHYCCKWVTMVMKNWIWKGAVDMIKQSKHWLTGLLMAAMVLSLTGCASVSAPTGNNQSADSSSSAKAVSHQRAQKKYADTKTSKASQSSSQTSQSISSSAAAATSSSLDGETVQSSDAAVQKAEPATSAAQTAVSQSVSCFKWVSAGDCNG